MKIKLLIFSIFFSWVGFGQGSEDFTNIPATSTSYSNRSWTGTNSVTWTAILARTDQTLTSRAICTNGSGTVTSPTYTGGIGTLNFNYARAFTGSGARSIQVWVNGSQIGSTITVSTTSGVVANYSQALNISGNVILELRTAGAQIIIDDISWTSSAPIAPVVTAATVTGSVGTALSYNIVATGSPTSYAYTGTLPAGLLFDTTTGAITGTPTASSSNIIAVTATNGIGTSTAANITFNISAVPAPVVSAASLTPTIGVAYSYFISASNSPTSYALASGTLPTGLTLNTTTGEISGTPTAVGTSTANVTATNAGGTSPAVALNFNVINVVSTCFTTGFVAGTTPPSGWIFNGITTTYTNAGSFGVASPSVSFDSNNDVITTEVLTAGSGATQLSFWFKGQGINSGSTSTFQIDGFDGTAWTNIDIINSSALIASSGTPVNKIYNFGSTPALTTGFVRFRFTYKKNVGNLAFDDVSVNCSSIGINIPVVIASAEIGTVGASYSNFISASNFPTVYTIVFGTLPTGLTFNTATGQVSGAPTTTGSFSVDVTATNFAGTSAVATISYSIIAYVPGCYLVDFADGTTKSSYQADNISLNGKIWNLSEALVGFSASDLSSSCIRMKSNGNAFATMVQDKAYGIDTISFDYRRFGSDTFTNQVFNVEYSKDSGNSWILIGSITPTAVVQTFNGTVSQAGPIRVRVLFASGTELAIAGRFNIDNINICDYVLANEIEVFGNATTIKNNSITTSTNNNTNFSSEYFVGVDAPIVKQFTITNYGTGTLNLSSLTIAGSSSFVITSGLSSSALLVGQSATFSVTFSSLSTGLKTATITIVNDDGDESTYKFLLSAKAVNYSKCTLIAPAILAQNDFDLNVLYTYTPGVSNTLGNYTVAGGTNYGANRTIPSNMFTGSNSLQSRATLNNFVFATLNTVNYQNIEMSFSLGAYGTSTTTGVISKNYFQVDISTDGGITFFPQLKVSGNSNSIFDINNTLPTNVAKFKPNSTVPTIIGCTSNSTNTISSNYKITNLPEAADLRVRITFLTDAASRIWALDNIIIKGQLPLTATWNGTNWLPTTPNLSTKAIIPVGYTANATNGSIDSCECQINSGVTVDIPAGYYLDIESNLLNNGTLNIADTSSLIQIDDDAINSGTGTTNVTRTTPNFDKYDYTYWSSPIKDDNLGARFSAWNNDFMFNFVTSNYSDQFNMNSSNQEGYPQVIGIPDAFDDDNNDWAKIISPATTTMTAGVGYAIMGGITGTFPRPETVTFSGKPNNGIITFPLVQSANTVETADDYNLVGNPYPSSIKADDFIKANITPLAANNNISGTLYFWTHGGNLQPALTNPGPNLNNYNANEYALYNLTGSTVTSTAAGSGGSVAPNGFIGSGQAFFVEAETTNDLVFDNSLRNKAHTNNQFFRGSNNIETKDRLWLNFSNVDNMFSQQLIGYLPETTLDFDYGYDGRENKTQNFVSFYSFMNAANNDLYKIQSRSDFDVNDFVKLGYSSAVAGQSSISIDRFEGVFDNQNIYLQDNLLNITHDLKQAPYNFTTTYGTFNDRFVLKYVNTFLANSVFETSDNNFKVAVKDNRVNLFSSANEIKSVEVFDIIGRRIYNNQIINSKTFIIENLNVKNQTLIVKVNLENGQVVSTKVVL